MKKIIYTSILLATVGAYAGTITEVRALPDKNGNYNIVFKNADINPASFNTNQPATIILDFPNTTSRLVKRSIDINENGIFSVDVVPGEGRTRAVVNLAVPATYNVSRLGKDVYLSIPMNSATLKTQSVSLADVPNQRALFNVPTTAKRVELNPSSSDNIKISHSPKFNSDANVKSAEKVRGPDLAPIFHRNSKEGGVFSFNLPSRDSYVKLSTEGTSVIATLPGVHLSKTQEKRLDVADYATPVRYIDIMRKGNDTKIIINMGRNAYEYITYQSGSTYNIEVNKPDLNSLDAKAKELTGFSPDKQYKGAPLSLNFQDIEVRAVLQIIAEFTNQNIVVSDSVSGNITLRLDNVPWDQALDIIMKTKNLAMRKSGEIIYIAPAPELDKSELDALTAWQEKQKLLPSQTDLIQVKYAKASDLAKIIEKSREIKTGNEGNTSYVNQDAILSSKGSVSVDERTNTLLVSDIPSKLQAVRDLVDRLDEPVRQVLVDARLVITSDNYTRDIGTRFGLSFRGNSHGTNIGGSGKLPVANYLSGIPTEGDHLLDNRLGVDLGASGAAARPASYGISILGSDVLVDLELQALQSEGRSEILSSPRVVTQDGYKATISSGQEIPYTTVSDKGTQTEFKSAKLSLEVTPRIAPNDRVSMEINIDKDRPNFGASNPPPIDTNNVNTKVEVENGETVVLGGIYEQSQSSSQQKVPLIGDIPVIGNAFKKTYKNFDKNELLIFITPRIIDKRLTDQDKFSNLRN